MIIDKKHVFRVFHVGDHFPNRKPWVYPMLAAMGPQVLNLAHNQLEVRGLEIVVQARSAGSAGGFTRARKP